VGALTFLAEEVERLQKRNNFHKCKRNPKQKKNIYHNTVRVP
jgi:hypothetical protein